MTSSNHFKIIFIAVQCASFSLDELALQRKCDVALCTIDADAK